MVEEAIVPSTSIGRGGRGISVDTRAASAALSKLASKLADRRMPNRMLSIQLYTWVARNFDSGGRMQNPPWAPLAESTRKQKARLGYSALPLLRTGNLRQSFAGFSDNDVAGVGAKASFGVDYADVQQEGIPGRLPARNMLPPIDYAYKSGVQVYNIWIKKSSKESGF